MKKATLTIITLHDYVLLGKKLSGEIGIGTWNAPGGKVESGESSLECAIREPREELGIILFREHLERIALIRFHTSCVPDFEVDVFWTNRMVGNPTRTKDMIPKWFHKTALPLSEMLESDRMWFPKAVSKERFTANVYYRERVKGFERIVFTDGGKG